MLVALHYARAGAASALGLRLRRRRPAHALDHRRHGGARARRRTAPRSATALDRDQSGGRPRARRARLPADRHRRRRRRHLAAGAARDAASSRRRRGGRRDHRLGDDDRGLRHHGAAGRPFPRSVLAARLVAVTGAASAAIAFVGRDPGGAGASSRARARRTGPAARGAQAALPRRHCARSGPSRAARRFTIFIFVSMLAYSAQELILEPFAGLVFGMTPGRDRPSSRACSTAACSRHDLVVSLHHRASAGRGSARCRLWTVAGLRRLGARRWSGIAAGGLVGPDLPLRNRVFALGVYQRRLRGRGDRLDDGLAGAGGEAPRGTRMGLWGAAQAIAFGARRLPRHGGGRRRARLVARRAGRPMRVVFTRRGASCSSSAARRWLRVGSARDRPAGARRRPRHGTLDRCRDGAP